MANGKLPLKCETKESNVTLGVGNKDKNKIVIQIMNSTDERIAFSGFGSRGEVSLTVFVGTQPDDLVGTAEESVAITIDEPEDWKDKTYKKLDNQAVWTFRLPKEIFKPKEIKTITIRDFECCTDPGNATLKISASISGYDDYENTLEVKKIAETFQLLYFDAEPPYIVSDQDKHDFTLRWNTIKAGKVILYKDESELATFTEGVAGFENGKEYSYKKDSPSLASTLYKLVAADQTHRQSKQLTVHVLQSGWYAVDFPLYGYPAVLFNMNQVNMNKVKLYAIFIKKGKASLCSSWHPYAVWDLENEVVPEKMATSPGVCFNNQLWLLGGSSVDSNNFSSRICIYHLENGIWNDQKATWSSRMGHAAVVFKNRLWILGGVDENGNSLKDVWSLGSDGNWQKHRDPKWAPRCMFAATAFNDRIWIYGGGAEPFGDPIDDMWTSRDGEKWERYQIIPKLTGNSIAKPISCTLQVVKKELNLMGSFRRDQTVTANICILNENQQTWFVSEVGRPWDQQGQNTHSLLSVEYKGLVFLRSLNYEIYNNPTKLYIYLP